MLPDWSIDLTAEDTLEFHHTLLDSHLCIETIWAGKVSEICPVLCCDLTTTSMLESTTSSISQIDSTSGSSGPSSVEEISGMDVSAKGLVSLVTSDCPFDQSLRPIVWLLPDTWVV